MIIKDTGGPAFPESGLSGLPNGEFIQGREGMTLRDYFAAKLMPMQLAREVVPWKSYNYENAAARCYHIADAMLKARIL